MRSLLVSLALIIALAAGGGASGVPEAAPRTLVLANGPIAAFAQDGTRIAWASADHGPGCVWLVRVRSLTSGLQYRLNSPGGPTCRSSTGFDLGHETQLALAGDSALWTLFDQGNFTYIGVMTGRVGRRPDVRLQELVFANTQYEAGWHLGGIAGDGPTLVYGIVRTDATGPPDCDVDGTCSTVVAAGGVQRVVGRAVAGVPGAPPALTVAAAGRRIAVVVARRAGPPVSAGTPARVEIRNAFSGALVRAFVPAVRPVAVALSGTHVALLGRTPGGKRLLRYSIAGTLLGSRSVPASVGEISLSRARVVFAVGRSIRLWKASGEVETLAIAAARPIGLSIEGRRVAWAENVTVGGTLRGRVRALTL